MLMQDFEGKKNEYYVIFESGLLDDLNLCNQPDLRGMDFNLASTCHAIFPPQPGRGKMV